MRHRTATTNDTGQLDRRTSVNSGKASQLARFTGIEGLSRLTDEEADALVEIHNNAVDEAAERGFAEGWDANESYNYDMGILHRATARTEH